MPLTDTRDLQRLAVLRRDLVRAKDALAVAVHKRDRTPEQQAVEQANLALSDVRSSIKESEYIIRDTACEHWSEDGDKHPWPGVVVKMYTVVEYDPKEALAWAKVNAPSFLRLNKSAFEKAAKVNLTGLVAQVKKEPRATIARDLSQYLPEPGEPEPVEDDREDIPI